MRWEHQKHKSFQKSHPTNHANTNRPTGPNIMKINNDRSHYNHHISATNSFNLTKRTQTVVTKRVHINYKDLLKKENILNT